ncbi:MAG: hypothetical protein JNM56_00795 [Planctomycetia bacterium]|nr:hypothetical protein [Planctomycetia bacterium]
MFTQQLEERLQQSNVGAADSPPEKANVRQLVDRYLKDAAGRREQAEARRKRDAEAAGFEVGKDLKLSASWQDGFSSQTADKAFTFRVGGRVDFDNTWYQSSRELSNSIGRFNNDVDPNLGLTDGSEFRRSRLRFQGTLWEVMESTLEVDFVNVLDLRRRTLGVTDPDAATSPISSPPSAPASPTCGSASTSCRWSVRSAPATRRSGSASPTPPAGAT